MHALSMSPCACQQGLRRLGEELVLEWVMEHRGLVRQPGDLFSVCHSAYPPSSWRGRVGLACIFLSAWGSQPSLRRCQTGFNHSVCPSQMHRYYQPDGRLRETLRVHLRIQNIQPKGQQEKKGRKMVLFYRIVDGRGATSESWCSSKCGVWTRSIRIALKCLLKMQIPWLLWKLRSETLGGAQNTAS